MQFMKYLFLVSILLIGMNCSKEQVRAPVIPEEIIVPLYADKLILQNQAKLLSTDSLTYSRQIDSLYQNYHVRTADVDSTLAYYKKETNRWNHLHELVGHRLEQLQQQEFAKH